MPDGLIGRPKTTKVELSTDELHNIVASCVYPSFYLTPATNTGGQLVCFQLVEAKSFTNVIDHL